MEQHIIKMVEDHEDRLKPLEEAEIRTNEQLITINDKLDLLIKKDEIFVRADLNNLNLVQIKKDINDVGCIARSAHTLIDNIKDKSKSKVEKYLEKIIIAILSLYVIGSLAGKI